MKPGDRVRMTKDFKRRMAETGSAAHIQEFGGCVGVVVGPVDYNRPGEEKDPAKIGPEVNVRWGSKAMRYLRYAYSPEHLEKA